jgi:hypothetical protein
MKEKKKMSALEKVKLGIKLNAILDDLRKNPAKQVLLLKLLEKYEFDDLAELLVELKDYYL